MTWTAASLTQGQEIREQARDIAALGQLTAWQLRIEARDDAERVLLASTHAGDQAGDRAAIGSLAFSPDSQEMVVTATGLEPPEPGREYRCWVTVDGHRERLGKMYFTADIAFWVGRVDALERVADGATFGVSLSEIGSQANRRRPGPRGRALGLRAGTPSRGLPVRAEWVAQAAMGRRWRAAWRSSLRTRPRIRGQRCWGTSARSHGNRTRSTRRS